MLGVPAFLEERWPLDNGRAVNDWNPQLWLTIVRDGCAVDFPRVVGDWHVVSERMRTVLTEFAPDAVQYLPIRIRTLLGQRVPSTYSVANYRLLLDVLDRERSTFLENDRSTDQSGDFRKLSTPVLSRRQIGPSAVFRVRGKRALVVYRRDVVCELCEIGIAGCVFSRIETSD